MTNLRTATELANTDLTDDQILPIVKAAAGTGLFRVTLASLKAYFGPGGGGGGGGTGTRASVVQRGFARGNASPLTVGLPAAPKAGNLIVLFSAGATTPFAVPAGFVSLLDTTPDTYQATRVYAKISDGSEQTLNVNGPTDNYNVAYVEISGATGFELNYGPLYNTGGVWGYVVPSKELTLYMLEQDVAGDISETDNIGSNSHAFTDANNHRALYFETVSKFGQLTGNISGSVTKAIYCSLTLRGS